VGNSVAGTTCTIVGVDDVHDVELAGGPSDDEPPEFRVATSTPATISATEMMAAAMISGPRDESCGGGV